MVLSSPGQSGYWEGKGPIECPAILPWHLIKGIKAWEAKLTGYPAGSIPSSYQKHQSSKRLNLAVSEVFWSEPSSLIVGKIMVLKKCYCVRVWEKKNEKKKNEKKNIQIIHKKINK